MGVTRDKKKSAEAALHESEAKYRFLAESMSQYVWTTDERGQIDYCNRHFLEYCGLTLEDVQAGRVLDFIHPDDLPELVEKANRSRGTGTPFQHEYRARRASDGVYRWHLCHSELFTDSDGRQRWLGVGIDITDRKHAELELQRAHEQMRMLVTSISESFIALDREWRFQYANQRVLNRLHKSWSDIAGKTLWEVFPDSEHSEFRSGYAKVMRERVAHTFDVRYPHPDGSTAYYQVHAYPTTDGLAALISNVTQQKQFEEDRSRLAAIVSSSDDAIVSKDLNGIVTSWNAAAERLFGYRAEEIIGKPILLIVPPELRAEETEILDLLRAGKKLDHYETERLRKDGSRVDVSLTISPLKDTAGNIIGASKIARDISDRKRVQQALMQSEKLAATGRMAAAIAHEVNNPLEGITNLAYLVSMDATLSETGRGYMKTLLEEIARASAITRQTLAFYRDTGKPARFDIRDVVNSVLRLNRPVLQKRSIEIVRDYRDSELLLGHASEIHQVVANLLLNAIDAVPDGGKIVVRVRMEEHNLSGHRIRVTIADNGHGVPLEMRQLLFQPFATTKGARGNGLGLWVSAGIVEKHGGRILMKTCVAPGRSGTTFSILLPLTETADAYSCTSVA